MSIEAMKQALEALEEFCQYANDQHQMNALTEDSWLWMMWKDGLKAITSLHQAIEQAEKQEPVGWIDSKGNMICTKINESCKPLYTTPPQRKWVGLMRGVRVDGDNVVITVKGGNESARQLCAELLKEKNT